MKEKQQLMHISAGTLAKRNAKTLRSIKCHTPVSSNSSTILYLTPMLWEALYLVICVSKGDPILLRKS